MKYYKLNEFLEAARPFAKQPGSLEDMERMLREKEAIKQGISTKDVVMVSDDSICEVIGSLTICIMELYIAIMSNFKKLGYKTIDQTTTETKSHLAFEKYWDEIPKYQGYLPINGTMWQSIKDEFCILHKYSSEKPLFLNLVKESNIIGVYVYGFRIPDGPQAICLGTDTASRGRVAFCKVLSTKELVAIRW